MKKLSVTLGFQEKKEEQEKKKKVVGLCSI